MKDLEAVPAVPVGSNSEPILAYTQMEFPSFASVVIRPFKRFFCDECIWASVRERAHRKSMTYENNINDKLRFVLWYWVHFA